MTTHRRIWNATAVFFAAAGIVLAIAISAPADLIAVAIVGVFVGGMLAILGLGAPAGSTDTVGWRRGAQVLALTAVVAVAMRGLIGTIGGSGVLIAFLLLISHPAVVGGMRRRLRSVGDSGTGSSSAGDRRPDGYRRQAAVRPGPSGPARAAVPTPPPVPEGPLVLTAPVSTSTTVELCRRWRRSFLVLQWVRAQGASAGANLERVVADRAAVLDELSARDPSGFQRWIEAGARAASDPARYLNMTARPRPSGGDVATA